MDKIMASRKIPKNYSNITGKLASEKSSAMLSYESKLERDFYFLFDFDQYIERIQDQPITIEYIYEGKRRTYTPDVLLRYGSSPYYVLGEVKYHDELAKNFQELRPKFEAAIDYCSKHPNMKFKLFTDRCPKIKNEAYRDNVRFLLSYKEIYPEYQRLIVEHFRCFDTVGELLEKITADRFEQMEIVPTLWAMMRYHAFEVDLFTKLSKNTVLENLGECIFPYKPERVLS